jgi:carboxymethylenebutenolidase
MSATVDVTTPDGVADAYRADGDGPPVLFIMDAYGLRPQIAEMVDRIAARGYTVLAPNVFYRHGRAPVIPLDGIGEPGYFDKVMPLVRSLKREQIVRDAPAYLDALGDGPVAISGYCMGGRVGWHVATAFPDRVAALGGFHVGSLVTDAPDSPHTFAGDLTAEVYLGYADNDRSATPEQIAALDAALDAAGVRHETEVYEGAAHGYTMADTPAYHAAAAERHYDALFALLDRTIGS